MTTHTYERTHQCIHCGRDFVAHHPKGQYCSSTCRSLAYRRRQRLELVALRQEKAAREDND